jgi:hypothetical protein
MMETRFDVAGRVQLSLHDADETVRDLLRVSLDPYQEASSVEGEPDIVLAVARPGEAPSFEEVQNTAGDDLITGADGTSYYVVQDGRWCSLPLSPTHRPAHFSYEPGFPVWRILGLVIRPALQLALLDREAGAIHAAAVDLDGVGLVIGGWSETGKTETALAFAEAGGRFISDKWTIVGSDGLISAFPIPVGIRRWVVPYLPRFQRALPRRARAQLRAAAIAATAARPLLGRKAKGPVGGLLSGALRHAVALGDRASLRPSEVRAAYGQADDSRWNAALGTVVLLTTVPGDAIEAVAVDPHWAARRLARAAAFERRDFFALYDRARYAFPDRDGDFEAAIVDREERFLAGAFESKQVISVKAPFPTDPRRVVDAIARCL